LKLVFEINPNAKVGRDGALRRPRRRAQRQATERVRLRLGEWNISSARAARAGTAQRAALTNFAAATSEFGFKPIIAE
jgi:hypothetical protein